MKYLVFFTFLFFIAINSTAQTNMKQKPATLNHIALYVFDLKKSTVFYQDIIGLNSIPEPFHDGKHAWFAIGPHSQLHLIEGASTVIPHEKSTHICFSVDSIETFIKKLERENISYENFKGDKSTVTIRPDGIKQIWFTDPNGFWIEVNNDRY